jgi:hypothetical protein
VSLPAEGSQDLAVRGGGQLREGEVDGAALRLPLVPEAEHVEGEAPAVGGGEQLEGGHARAGHAERQRVVDTERGQVAKAVGAAELRGRRIQLARPLGVRLAARAVADRAGLGVDRLRPGQRRPLRRRRPEAEAHDRLLARGAARLRHRLRRGPGPDAGLDFGEFLPERLALGGRAEDAVGEAARVAREADLLLVLVPVLGNAPLGVERVVAADVVDERDDPLRVAALGRAGGGRGHGSAGGGGQERNPA